MDIRHRSHDSFTRVVIFYERHSAQRRRHCDQFVDGQSRDLAERLLIVDDKAFALRVADCFQDKPSR